ncbi:MAG TPA: 50S ribosomal protein L4 [Candidatus Paceibacterota bacterium]|nr:50S ribosomal protein L4 [Candidatus Paceibacterota bacterium]
MATKEKKSLEAPVYTQEGKKSGTVALPESVFGTKWNADLVHQVVTGIAANMRRVTAHTKDRSEVRGGGKKPWKQKGTGRARHGSSRSPIWRHGGVTHGPRNDKVYAVKINQKMRAKALMAVLAKKYQDGEVLFLDKVAMQNIKAKDAKAMLAKWGAIPGYESLSTRRNNAAYIALPEYDATVQRSFRNFGNLRVSSVRNLNAFDAMKYRYVVVVAPDVAVKFIEAKA